MNSTTPFPAEMRPVPARNRGEDVQPTSSPFETLDACDLINRIITDLTDRLDPVLVSEKDIPVVAQSEAERPKAKLPGELERIAFRLRCLDQRIAL